MDNNVDFSQNVVFIEFYNKKYFPIGPWLSEPDLCRWTYYGFTCLAIRDMSLGMWRGFVGLTSEHPAYNKEFKELLNHNWLLNLSVHGGIALIGKLPDKYKEYNEDLWWFGFESTQGEDFLPLLKYDEETLAEIQSQQTYKTLNYIRKETNWLAKQLWNIKK